MRGRVKRCSIYVSPTGSSFFFLLFKVEALITDKALKDPFWAFGVLG